MSRERQSVRRKFGEHLKILAAQNYETLIAVWTAAMIVVHLLFRAWLPEYQTWPLFAAITAGMPLVGHLGYRLLHRQFGSDLLAGISIVVSVMLGEYLAGALVVLMLSGGAAMESYAVGSASSVLRALSKRLPAVAHRRRGVSVEDIPLKEVAIGDEIIVFPHETCPIDGTVIEGNSSMDESYLTGEPYVISKSPGSAVLSGAINGTQALVARTETLPIDSRYSKIIKVMQESAEKKPKIRRLGDTLGAFYTPIALAIAALAWVVTGEPLRFLSVLVVATPCPLLIAIPVAIVGSISLAAKRSIIVRDPAALERAESCRTIIFDKTGTLTYGKPRLEELVVADGQDRKQLLGLVASLERYSKHPLSAPILQAAKDAAAPVYPVSELSERPGEGLRGMVAGKPILITNRAKYAGQPRARLEPLPPQQGGMECVVLIEGALAALIRFRDEPRVEGLRFVRHLHPQHGIERVLIVSGDRESEVRYLAERVGIQNVFFGQSPEQKVQIVEAESQKAKVIFVGDGINDAPALRMAHVGIAFGQHNDVTMEAGDAVVLDSSLQRVDEFLHISRRMRRIALQSAIGGMAVSGAGMLLAAFGFLTPVAGAIVQEVIDVAAVANALRVSLPYRALHDFGDA